MNEININDAIQYFLRSDNKFNKRKFINDTSAYKNCINDNFIYDSIEELSYIINNNISQKPVCPTCGKTLQFSISKNRYKNHCNASCATKDPDVIKKHINTCIELYGDPTYNNHQKYKETCKLRYGVDYILSKHEFREKGKTTKLIKYGDANYSNKEKTLKTCFERYGNGRNTQKIQQTMLERYGVKSYLCSDEINSIRNNKDIQNKITETKRKNKTFNTSKIENTVYNRLLKIFSNVERQYKSEQYNYNCDFYIPEIALYIECNFHWTHGNHPFDNNNIEDLKTLEKWKMKGTKYCLNAINTWTIRDVEKRNVAINNKLNYIEFFSINEFNKYFDKYEQNNKDKYTTE